MLQNIVDFKAKSFLSERNTSTMAYEVKAVRAMWDPSLSIPGTNRRGGWRCPVGTRYGGQITDRFGRSCGWGVARRIANQISDIGQRLENVDDARRGRRIARRERRILARLNPEGGGAGRLERGLRGVADRLEVADTPSPRDARRRTVVARPPSIDAPDTPRELTPASPASPAPRAPRRRRAPNLRESEQRRMDREIEQPGAPRTGEAPVRPVRPVRPARRRQPARPQGDGNLRESEQRRMDREIVEPGAPRTGEAPARRRRRAVIEATKKPKAPKQQAENAVEKPVVEPKIVKPRRPRQVPRGESDNAARSEEVRANRARGAGKKVDLNQALGDGNFQEYVARDIIPNDRIMIINDAANFPESPARKRTKRDEARQKITVSNARLQLLEQAIERGELSDNDFIERNGEKINIARVKTYIKDYRDSWQEILDANKDEVAAPVPAIDPIDDPFKTPKPVKAIDPKKIAYKQPELDAVGDDARKKILDDVIDKINNSNISEASKRAEIINAVAAIEELKYHNDENQAQEIRQQQKRLLSVLQKVQNGVAVETALDEYRAGWEGVQGSPRQMRTLIAMKKAEVDAAWELLNRADALGQSSAIRNLDRKIQSYVAVKKRLELHDRFENDLKNAISRIEQGQVLDESKGTLAQKTPNEIVEQVRIDIEKAVEKRGKKLDEYLADKWKDSAVRPKFEDMTPEKWQNLSQAEKKKYLTEAYSHKLIKGKNGKFYNAVVGDVDGQNRFEIIVDFNEVDKDGNIIRGGVARARRLVTPGNNGEVYQASFFINRDSDKGADLATIFNQQAFLYLKNMGIKKAGVGPADDGRYVWGRVGFKTEMGVHTREQFASISGALDFYKKFGPGGLIATDEQYFKVKKLLELAKGGTKVHHQDFHFAVDSGKEMLDKVRRDYIKHWFSGEVPLGGAALDFGEQKIGAFVSPRNKKKKAIKKI